MKLTITRVTNVESTWLGLEWPPAQYVAKRHASLSSRYLVDDSLHFGVNEIINFQKLI